MSDNELTQPPCSYCGSPTEPVRQKKLKSTKHFYCSEPCTKKHELLLSYEEQYNGIEDTNTKEHVKSHLKVAIDMLYASQCMKSQDCVLIFADSTYSFKLENSVKHAYQEMLNNRGKEMVKAVETMLDHKKILIRKHA